MQKAEGFPWAFFLGVVPPYSAKIDFLWVPFGTSSAPITTVTRAIMIGYHRPEQMLPVWSEMARTVAGYRQPNQPFLMW